MACFKALIQPETSVLRVAGFMDGLIAWRFSTVWQSHFCSSRFPWPVRRGTPRPRRWSRCWRGGSRGRSAGRPRNASAGCWRWRRHRRAVHGAWPGAALAWPYSTGFSRLSRGHVQPSRVWDRFAGTPVVSPPPLGQVRQKQSPANWSSPSPARGCAIWFGSRHFLNTVEALFPQPGGLEGDVDKLIRVERDSL